MMMMMEKTNYQLLLLLLSISSLLFLSLSAEAFCFPGSTTCQVHHQHPGAAPSPAVDPAVEQICQQTSYPSVCISTLTPFPSESMDSPTAILETAVNATLNLTEATRVEATRLPYYPHRTVREYYFLMDCPGVYSDVVGNLEIAVQAIGDGDEGSFTDELNNVIEGYNLCEVYYTAYDDSYSYYAYPAINIKLPPFNGINWRLTQMAINCLNISTAIPWPSSS